MKYTPKLIKCNYCNIFLSKKNYIEADIKKMKIHKLIYCINCIDNSNKLISFPR